jgi:hypothetical protein
MMNETVNEQTQEIQCDAKSLTGADPVKVTVGEIFQIECLSETISFNPSQVRFLVQLETKEGKKIDDPFSLKLFKADISPQGKWIMQVVSYKVGPYNNFKFQMTDGVTTLPVKGVSFNVESVIDQSNPPKAPFGPFGPFMTEFPWGGVAVIVSILLIAIFGIVIKSIRLVQKKKLKERMKKYDSPQLPVAQFYAEMRKLEREIDFVFAGKLSGEAATAFVKRFEDALKLYLVRQFQIPTFEWPIHLVLKEFKSRYVWFGEEIHTQLSILFRELEKSQKKDVAITSHDVHQMLKNLKRWVDRASYMTDKYKLKVSEL